MSLLDALNAPCTCDAHRDPTRLPHASSCRWRPITSFSESDLRQLKPGPDERVAAAVERARAERAAPGPGPNGRK